MTDDTTPVEHSDEQPETGAAGLGDDSGAQGEGAERTGAELEDLERTDTEHEDLERTDSERAEPGGDATGGESDSAGPAYRAGFVSFVGRPNVGKSTLTNALVGQKIAITSSKPQTTRRAIRGVVHRPDGQIIVVDTPGIHRPRTLLGERLNSLVTSTLGDVDVIGMLFPADEPIGPGDRFINEQLDAFPRARKIAVVSKVDLSSKKAVAKQLLAVSELREWDTIVPISAVTEEQLDVLAREVLALLPTSPAPLYPEEAVTDEDNTSRIAEFIREAALEGVSDELPHSLAVTIDDIAEREDGSLIDIWANVFVERDSQKGIIIGKGGQRLREVGAVSRAQIEGLLGRQVFLSLRVKVAKDWQRDPKLLGRLGF